MPNLVNPYRFAVPPPPSDIEVVAFDSLAMTTTASPAVTIDGYDPAANDIVVAWVASTSGATVSAVASGWVNVLGGTTSAGPGDGTVQVACLYHVVTAGEETANTNSWTLTNLWNVTETGEVIAVVVRGADSTTVLDSAASAVDATIAATHILAGLTGANLSTGSLVLSAVFPDALETYTAPSGWTSITATSGTNQGGHAFRRTAVTSAGVDVSPTNITPSSSDEYASITVALLEAP